MKLVIGGYAQGRLAYVLQQYEKQTEDVFDLAEHSIFEWNRQTILYHMEELATQAEKESQSVFDWLERYLPLWNDCILITQEVGCGLVPITPEERQWRETVGRMNIWLAAQAETVERIFCGLSMHLFPLSGGIV